MGSGNLMFLIVLGLLALVLLDRVVLARWIEGWGMRAAQAGTVRGPYGRLVSTRIAAGNPIVDRPALLTRSLLVSIMLSALVVAFALLAPGEPDYAAIAPGVSSVALVAAIAVGCRFLGFRQAALYGLAGNLLFGALLAIPIGLVTFAFGSANPVSYALFNLLPAVSTSLGLALAPCRLRFERTFEDGHVDRIWVSERSRAFASLNDLTCTSA